MNVKTSEYLEIFRRSQRKGLSPKTVNRKMYEVSKFFEYLNKRDIQSLENLDIQQVYDYLNSLDCASQTISCLQFTLRELFDVMYKHDLSDVDGRHIFPVIFTNKRDRILSYYSTDEIKDVISQIDINLENGVRDKCMILLAAQTGLRSGDILGLTFKEIFWDKSVISKIQSKTGIRVSVPLPENLKYLLIDYIKNHRPHSDEDYIFICQESKTRYSDAELYSILRKYFKKSTVIVGNRKHGPHALRHSLAARLLDNNTPMPVITGILGHKNINTTAKYLSIDIEGLRRASLEVPTDEN
ncbi:MAG: tyrosine-type recombinase/integrase [bacterium]|nr:tyrosine-type recombinase/integrase [bacterium]